MICSTREAVSLSVRPGFPGFFPDSGGILLRWPVGLAVILEIERQFGVDVLQGHFGHGDFDGEPVEVIVCHQEKPRLLAR